MNKLIIYEETCYDTTSVYIIHVDSYNKTKTMIYIYIYTCEMHAEENCYDIIYNIHYEKNVNYIWRFFWELV